jgi:hypothetical protein
VQAAGKCHQDAALPPLSSPSQPLITFSSRHPFFFFRCRRPGWLRASTHCRPACYPLRRQQVTRTPLCSPASSPLQPLITLPSRVIVLCYSCTGRLRAATHSRQPAIRCAGNTYAPPGNRLQACLPCQSGLAVPPTYYGLQSDRTEVCLVPPGRFWELNVVRECPQVS